ncbi:putative phosphodiesterase [Filimonas zeae]|uniref:Phosphoesterase n=1 Tax=Filimonas zeae TaxID=1737353 RepID=A0A917ISF1_9BACT|nr:metallophosphoesterase family protein [Filimonas zeae]MDR6338166.1 putative phosphodiesterase [Filimonas zeae]GGH62049.1 phosphoesterase [Filimonas zeae]
MKKINVLLGCITLAATAKLAAQVTPDRIVLNVTANPATSLAVTWRTGNEVKEAVGEIVVAADGPDLAKELQQVKAVTTPFGGDSLHAAYHSVVFRGLQPKTKYMYRVGGSGQWSEWFQVQTAGVVGDTVKLIYMGDAQNNIKSLWSRTIRQAFMQMPDANLMIHAGDLVNRGQRDEEWGEFFYAGSFIHSVIPGMMVVGNHEHSRDSAGEFSLLTPHWQAQFTLPENGAPGVEETCYFTDIQGVRFIALNSQAINLTKAGADRQYYWLDSLLSHNPNKWTCISFHHPVFSAKASRDNETLRKRFKPLFDKHRVDLILQGHDHAYARGIQPVEGLVKDTTSGTMYVISVSGPKMYELNKEPWMKRTAMNTQLFQLVRIAGDTLLFETYTTTGKLFDAFKLVKQKGKLNKCIEMK